MKNKKQSLKQRKQYRRYVEKGTIRTSGKTEHATGWLNHVIGVTDPLLTAVMPVSYTHLTLPTTD